MLACLVALGKVLGDVAEALDDVRPQQGEVVQTLSEEAPQVSLELIDILCLLLGEGDASEVPFSRHSLRGSILEPRVGAHCRSHGDLVALRLLRFVHSVRDAGVVESYLLDIAKVEMHGGQALVGTVLGLQRFTGPRKRQHILVADDTILVLLELAKAVGHLLERKHLADYVAVGVGAVPQLAVHLEGQSVLLGSQQHEAEERVHLVG